MCLFKKLIMIIILLTTSITTCLTQNIETLVKKYEKLPLTLENVANAIVELKIRYPEMVFRQTIKESGWNVDKTKYASKLANKYNNLFGMRKAKSRKTYALDKIKFGYATYKHWIYSILDYKIWQDCVQFIENETFGKYLIRRGYAKDTKKYIKGLMYYDIPANILNKFKLLK